MAKKVPQNLIDLQDMEVEHVNYLEQISPEDWEKTPIGVKKLVLFLLSSLRLYSLFYVLTVLAVAIKMDLVLVNQGQDTFK